MTYSIHVAGEHELSGGRSNHELTVCTVSYNSARHLRANWRLTQQQNSGTFPIRWIVAENSPCEAPYRLAPFENNDDWLTVIRGPEKGSMRANMHHAIGLHICLNLVKSRFVVVLDPDFYFVRTGWANSMIDHMLSHDIAIFGVPWHPKFNSKYRYFPCVHCMFIDLHKIPVDSIDFLPITDAELSKMSAPPKWRDNLYSILGLSHRHASPQDTGTRFYKRFHNISDIRFECAVPVYQISRDSPQFGRTIRSRVMQRLLPDHLCYVPKKKGYFTDRGFAESGLCLSKVEDWEEYMWQQAPFGLHVRRSWRKEMRDENEEIRMLEHIVADLVARCE